ncbi:MAG: glycosyl hydrolase-related protein, partial [Candidatus Alcyoniella australis]|nr:glycosyl hydrolase-related protein [Candidatus Alcyoniella australis]
ENFGKPSTVGWLIDSFGISPQMPQVLVKSGTTALVYSRREPRADVPSEFDWIGLDGTRITTAHLPRMYFAGYPLAQDEQRGLYQLWRVQKGLRNHAAGDQLLVPAGVDHGRPQSTAKLIERWNELHPQSPYRFSTPGRFFRALRGAPMAEMHGELGPDLAGCYGARVRTKQLNRRAEAALREAEFAAAWSQRLGNEDRNAQLDPAWERTLCGQFHDAICGPLPDHVAAEVDAEFEHAIALAREVRDQCLAQLARTARCGEGPYNFLAANPLPFERLELIRISFNPSEGQRRFRVLDDKGRTLPHQVLAARRYADGGLDEVNLGFVAKLPAAGWRTFSVVPVSDPPAGVEAAVQASLKRLHGPLIEAQFDPRDGRLLRLISADGSTIETPGGGRLALQRDPGSLYYGLPLGRLHNERGPYSVRLLERGPLLARLSVEGRIGHGRFRRIFTLTHCLPYLEVQTEVDFADPGRRLIFRLPTNLSHAVWRNEVPGGFVECNGGERPAVGVSDLTSLWAGVSLLNCGVPGHRRHGSELRSCLHRSTDKIHFYRSGGGALGIGVHRARLGLMPHGPNFAAAAPWRCALRMLHPPLVVPLEAGSGKKGVARDGLLDLEPAALCPDALYREDGELVLRFHESAGKKQQASVRLGRKPSSARLTDLLGRDTQGLDPAAELKFQVGPYEIVTLRMRD